MAYIIKSEPTLTKSAGDTVPPLARATWDGQMDIYKLAKMGDRGCQRRWNELCAYPPSAGTVRLIVKVEAEEREKDRQANEQMEQLITKASSAMAAPAAPAEPAWLTSLRNSPDPAQREAAWQLSMRRHGGA